MGKGRRSQPLRAYRQALQDRVIFEDRMKQICEIVGAVNFDTRTVDGDRYAVFIFDERGMHRVSLYAKLVGKRPNYLPDFTPVSKQMKERAQHVLNAYLLL
jgi:hypothetical protein